MSKGSISKKIPTPGKGIRKKRERRRRRRRRRFLNSSCL
jgi:hypothetical protein